MGYTWSMPGEQASNRAPLSCRRRPLRNHTMAARRGAAAVAMATTRQRHVCGRKTSADCWTARRCGRQFVVVPGGSNLCNATPR